LTRNEKLVRECLSRVPHVPKGSEILIRCPFHDDRKPSCGVNVAANGVPVGAFHCFSCGAGGHWNKLAAKMGWPKLGERKDQVGTVPDVRGRIARLTEAKDTWADMDPALRDVRLTDPTDWRGIPESLMREMGCKRFLDDRGTRWVVIPVTVHGETKGLIRARETKAEGRPSYLFSPGQWVKDGGLPCLDASLRTEAWRRDRTILVAEGARDAMALLSHGVPAVGVMGTGNWSPAKKETILNLDPVRVGLMMDGDAAGRTAAAKMQADLAAADAVRMDMPDGTDPADLTRKQARRAWKRLKGERRCSDG